MSAADPPPIDVVAGLVFRGGRLLITRRPPGSHLAGLWEFPGGKLEPGESWEEGLVRELQEELGITVAPGPQIDELVHRYPEKTVRIRFLKCRLVSGTPRPVGCDRIEWVGRDGLDGYEFPPADARLLARLTSCAELWDESV